MHMLGANLSIEYRRQIGIFCAENKIGFHKFTSEERAAAGRIGGAIARDNKLGFHGLSSEELREIAAQGGRIGGKKCYESGSGIFSLTPEEKLAASIAGGKKKGGLKLGRKYWVKDGVQVSSRNCPGDGWINATIPTDKQIESRKFRKHTKKYRITNIKTGEIDEIVLIGDDTIEDFLLKESDWTITRNHVSMTKHGIYLWLKKSEMMQFMMMGWKMVSSAEKNRLTREEHLSKPKSQVIFNNIKTHIPTELIETFKNEGWDVHDNTTENAWVIANGYKLYVKTKDVPVYESYGWDRCEYFIKPKPVKERYPGCNMTFTKTGIGIQVAFSDVPIMLNHGLEITAKHPKEVARIHAKIKEVFSSI